MFNSKIETCGKIYGIQKYKRSMLYVNQPMN